MLANERLSRFRFGRNRAKVPIRPAKTQTQRTACMYTYMVLCVCVCVCVCVYFVLNHAFRCLYFFYVSKFASASSSVRSFFTSTDLHHPHSDSPRGSGLYGQCPSGVPTNNTHCPTGQSDTTRHGDAEQRKSYHAATSGIDTTNSCVRPFSTHGEIEARLYKSQANDGATQTEAKVTKDTSCPPQTHVCRNQTRRKVRDTSYPPQTYVCRNKRRRTVSYLHQ